jgi:3-deoxy-D-manno-octulosonic acid kinase
MSKRGKDKGERGKPRTGVRADSFLPYGFTKVKEGRTSYYLKGELVEPILESGALSLDKKSTPKGTAVPLGGGRGSAFKTEIGGVGGVVVRRYRRGGLFGKIVKDRYFVPHRALSELFALTTARTRGVSAPVALGASEKRRRLLFIPSPFYTAAIATAEISASVNLPEYLRREVDPKTREKTLVRAGTAIKKMHDAGIYHSDLNMNNLLVGSGEGEIFVIDFDRAVVCDLLSRRRRERNLRRLLRSLRKLARSGLPITDDDFKHILTGYADGDEAVLVRLVKKTISSRLLKIRGRVSEALRNLFKGRKGERYSSSVKF